MRVDRVYINSLIILENNGRELARFRERHLTPGEMIKNHSKKKKFSKIQKGQLT